MKPDGISGVQPEPSTNPWLSGLLIGIVGLYIALLLGIPVVNIFYQAFREGIPAFLQHLTERELLSALRLTVLTALVVVPLNTLFGLCAALALARRRFPGRALLLSLIDLPFSISPVVAGLMLVLIFGRQGWLGSWNLRVIFAFPGIVLATAFITLPFVVREVLPVLEEAGTEEEEAAKTLGGQFLADLLAHHPAQHPLGPSLRRHPDQCPRHGGVRGGGRGLRQHHRPYPDPSLVCGRCLPQLCHGLGLCGSGGALLAGSGDPGGQGAARAGIPFPPHLLGLLWDPYR